MYSAEGTGRSSTTTLASASNTQSKSNKRKKTSRPPSSEIRKKLHVLDDVPQELPTSFSWLAQIDFRARNYFFLPIHRPSQMTVQPDQLGQEAKKHCSSCHISTMQMACSQRCFTLIPASNTDPLPMRNGAR